MFVHELREQGIASGDPVVEERTYWFEDGGFEPLAHREKRVDDVGRESGGWFHYKNDPIGTPERLVAEDGSVAAEYERRAWGQLEQRAGAKATTPLRLQGQYWDEETGLAYNRWRYYDGEGRIVSADPIGLNGGPNPYALVRNPATWVDPLGLAGGRRGNAATRAQLDEVRAAYQQAHPDHVHVGGGRRACTGEKVPEIYIPPWDGGRKGGSYPDLSFRAPDGTMHHVNTVDVAPTRASGMTRREEENAARIFETLNPGDSLTLVPKKKL